MAYGLTLYIDQSNYKLTSPYIDPLYDWIRGMVSYPQNSHLPRYRLSPPLITITTYHHHLLPPPTTATYSADWQATAIDNSDR